MTFNLVETLLNVTLIGTEWILWLLVVLSHVSISIALERAWFFSRQKTFGQEGTKKLQDMILARHYQNAIHYCEMRADCLEAKVALEGLRRHDAGLEVMKQAMEGFLLRQKKVLDQGLMVLATLGNNAPFIGLFGTVLGIIKSFHDLGLNPMGGAAVVMAGISEALVATAVGLLVAIPAVVFYNTFQRKVKVMTTDAESLMSTIIAKYH